MKKLESEKKLVRTGLRIPKKLYDKFRRKAYLEKKSINLVLIETLEKGMKEEKR